MAELMNGPFPKPRSGEVYKDECSYTYITPKSDGGLYICLHTFTAVSRQFVPLHVSKTNRRVFLHHWKEPVPGTDQTKSEMADDFNWKLQLGSQLYVDNYDVLVVEGEEGKSYSLEEVPAPLKKACEETIAATSVDDSQIKLDSDLNVRLVSHAAKDLFQEETGKKVSMNPDDWVCEYSGSKKNLWVNLSDGKVVSGSVTAGGTGDGLKHFEKTRYPLAVKLETLCPENYECWSYIEDSMVEVPDIDKYLQKWGIDRSKMKKGGKTMAQLDMELNKSWDSKSFKESTKDIQLVYGPGYCGIENLGNSCYMNSVFQALFQLPTFHMRYTDARERLFNDASRNAAKDFDTQMAKLGSALISTEYTAPPTADQKYPLRPSPYLLRLSAAAGNAVFTNKEQQDALEYYQHLLTVMERADAAGNAPIRPQHGFKFRVEERLQCSFTQRVLYRTRDENVLQLAVNDTPAEGDGPHTIPLQDLLAQLFAPETLQDWKNPELDAVVPAEKTLRLSTFPDYLFLAVRRYTFDSKYQPVKLNTIIPAPFEIDLNDRRAAGQQPGEELMAGEEPGAASGAPAAAVEALVAVLGLTQEQAMGALKRNRNDPNLAIDWAMNNPEELDIAAAEIMTAGPPKADEPLTDGKGKYSLKAVIGHIGSNPGSGHYVCYVRDDERWVLFNDETVGVVTSPPWNIAYMYLYVRTV